MPVRKVDVPVALSTRQVSALLGQHSHYTIGVGVSVGKVCDRWCVYMNGVCWNNHIPGTDETETYQTVEEAMYVSCELGKLLEDSKPKQAARKLMRKLNQGAVS